VVIGSGGSSLSSGSFRSPDQALVEGMHNIQIDFEALTENLIGPFKLQRTEIAKAAARHLKIAGIRLGEAITVITKRHDEAMAASLLEQERAWEAAEERVMQLAKDIKESFIAAQNHEDKWMVSPMRPSKGPQQDSQ
jgi:hypothetical protein